MNAIKKLIAVVLTAVLAAVCMIGCSSKVLKESTVKTTERLIAGWDSNDDFGYFGASEAFGITRLNTDKTYVKQGEGSMYVKVEGNYDMHLFPGKYNDKKPFIRLLMSYVLAMTDFSKAQSFTMDVYNASDRDISIGLRFSSATGRGDYGAALDIALPSVPLIKDSWNKVVFDTSDARFAYLGLGDVETLDIYFENRGLTQTPAEVYIDNLCVNEAASAHTAVPAPTMANGNIITDYSDSWFTTTAFAYSRVCSPQVNSFYLPETSRNIDPDYIKTGSTSLKVERKPYRYHDTGWRAMCEVGLFGVEYLDKIDFSARDAAATDIVLDVYNDYQYEIDFSLIISSGDIEVEKLFVMQPNSWNELRMPMDLQHSTGLTVNYSNIIKLNMRFYEHYGFNAVHYVDNVRFEARG